MSNQKPSAVERAGELFRPNGGNANHDNLISQIIKDFEGSKRSGFWTDHRVHCEQMGIEHHRFPFQPDAYRFNYSERQIELYEVEVHSPLSGRKISLLGEFWEWWDDEAEVSWTPILIIVDRYGNRNKMDLCHAVYGTGWAKDLAE